VCAYQPLSLARRTGQVAFEFRPKQRESKEPDKVLKAANTKKQQKQFYDLQTRRDYERLRAMLNKSFDPNCHYDQNGAHRERERERDAQQRAGTYACRRTARANEAPTRLPRTVCTLCLSVSASVSDQ
jgi:hypothetical protein